MMIAGHDQNVQNAQRNDNKKPSSEMLDDSCCAFLSHARIILIIPFMYVFAF